MKAKVVKLPKADKALMGMSVPKEKHGNVAQLVQDTMIDLDYEFDTSGSVDIPKLKTEVKSKGVESRSAWSVGSMTLEDIISYDYDSSPLKEKIQTVYIVEHSQTFREVVSTRTLDFSKESIQEIIRYGYNSARDSFIEGDRSSYIKGKDAWCYFENKKKKGVMTNSWALRIPVDKMKILEGMARSNVERLFE